MPHHHHHHHHYPTLSHVLVWLSCLLVMMMIFASPFEKVLAQGEQDREEEEGHGYQSSTTSVGGPINSKQNRHGDDGPAPNSVVGLNRNPSYDHILQTGSTGLEYASYLTDHPEARIHEAVESISVLRYAPDSKTPTATFPIYNTQRRRRNSKETRKPPHQEEEHQHQGNGVDGGESDNRATVVAADMSSNKEPIASSSSSSRQHGVGVGVGVGGLTMEPPAVVHHVGVDEGGGVDTMESTMIQKGGVGGNQDGGGAGDIVDGSRLPLIFRTFPSVSSELLYHRSARHINGHGPPAPKLAYLIIISNEDFVDGALVLGRSLRLNSPFLRDSKADMCLIVPRGRISATSQIRLYRDGLFTSIIEVNPLAEMAPKAFWKDTFDKIYMFNLTQYEKVVFMDADMVCVRKDMDELFQDKYAKVEEDGSSVAAIGDKHGFGAAKGSYFQTGMMVIRPKSNVFDGIFKLFTEGVPPHGGIYNKGMHGRDGVLLRDYFKDSFHPLDNKYSRNLNPRWRIPQSVISLHLRGKHKPWFNKVLPNADPELGKKEFGFPYIEWWRLFEDHIHVQSEAFIAALYFELFPTILSADGEAGGMPPTIEELANRHGISSLSPGSSLPVKALDKIEDHSEAYANGPHIAIRASVLDTLRTLKDNHHLVTNALKKRWLGILRDYGKGASESEDDIVEETNNVNSRVEDSVVAVAAADEEAGKKTNAAVELSPLTHVWMMRGNPKKAYTQHLLAVDRRRRMSLEGLLPPDTSSGNHHPNHKAKRSHQHDIAAQNIYVVAGKPGVSCADVCRDPVTNSDSQSSHPEHHELPPSASPPQVVTTTTVDGGVQALPPALGCSVPHLKYGGLQSCEVLKRLLGCSRCEAGIYWRPHPGNDYPSRLDPALLKEEPSSKKKPKRSTARPQISALSEICYFNYLHDERSVPNCTAAMEGVSRLCPCVGGEM